MNERDLENVALIIILADLLGSKKSPHEAASDYEKAKNLARHWLTPETR
jgi:hypothetical protein